MEADATGREDPHPATGDRLLVVVAHPDDESFGTGSVIADAARRGVAVTVACATRGEAGEPVAGSLLDGETLAAARERELREAAALLGVERVEVFDWCDSGMEGEPAADTLVAAPIETVAERIAALVDEVRPTVIVTLDAGDGHRDHAHVRDATLVAADRARWSVARIYLHCLPQRLMRQWVEALQEHRPDAAHLALGELGTPDDEITTLVDTSAVRARRDAAIAVHATQVSPYAVMPDRLRDAFLDEDALRRVRPPWDGETVERSIWS